MFGFLKEKLKDAVSVFTKKVDEVSESIPDSDDDQKSLISDKAKKVEVKEKTLNFQNYFIYKFSGRNKDELYKQIEDLENKYGKGFVYDRDLKEEGELREDTIRKFKEKIKEFSKTNPKMKFIIDYSHGLGRLMSMELEEAKKYRFEIVELNKPGKEIPAKTKEIKSLEQVETELKPKRATEIVEQLEQASPEKKGFFAKIKERITSKKLDEKQFNELFWDLEVVLLENNVAVEIIEKIKQNLKKNLVDEPIKRSQIEQTILNSLKQSIEEVLTIPSMDILSEIKKQKPYVICFFGINGSGKTTSIAKLAHLLQKKNISTVMAASDTFRAAAIQQLEEHANNLNIKIIKHDYGSDSAAVAFDAVKHAKANNIDVVLVDTAGRMHSNTNLMEELKKIVKVIKPNLNIFVGESVTGNDCVEQAKIYDEQIGMNAIILTKADVDDKGGAALSISYITKKPILFLGVGQEYGDLKVFDKDEIIDKIL